MLDRDNNFKLNRSILCWLPRISLGLLVVLGLLALCPVSGNDGAAYAEEPGKAGTYAALAMPTVTLSMADSISEEVNPTLDGTFQSLATVAKVAVANADNYSISISGNPEMSGQKAGNTAKLRPVTANTIPERFEHNTWGYSFVEGDNIAPNENTAYNPISVDGTTLVDKAEFTDGSVSKTYTLAFGAKISSTIPADTYSGNVVLSVVATPKEVIEYSLNYDANGGSGTANPARQSELSQAETHEFTVAAQGTLSKLNHVFLGWAESSTATTAQYTAGSSKITLTKASPTKTLYAVWRKATLSDLANMQDMTTEICTNSALNESKQLTDTRDSKRYQVTKLKDGNCWMTQNLDYDIPGKKLSIGIASVTDAGNFWDDGNTTNGNYYQFSAAAIACNLGGNWRLPTSNSTTTNGSFGKLTTAYGANTGAIMTAAPLNFPYAGRVDGYNGSLGDVGSYGVYWSSTPDGGSFGYFLYFDSSCVKPSIGGSSRYPGLPVRCLVLGA